MFAFDPDIRTYLIIGVCFICGYFVVAKVIETLRPEKSGQERKDHENRPPPKQKLEIGEDQHFQVLGILPTRDYEEIKKAYHQKIKQYHPDRTAGLAQDFHDLAVSETKKINAAYEALIQRFGGKQGQGHSQNQNSY